MPAVANGWHDLCQQCWEEANEGSYLPEEARDYAICEGCGDNTLVYGHRGPFTVKEAQA